MEIHPKDLNLYQLLSVQSEQFIIPSYQRRYAWGHNQIAALFEDIDMLQDNDGHLLGMLILHSSTNQGVNVAEVVDGQQRMTTISLLLIAIKNAYSSHGNNSKADEISRMLYCKGYDDIEKIKLVLGELDNKDYQKILKGDSDGLFNKKIEYTYNWYTKKIKEHDIEWLNRFYYKFVNVAIIIRLNVGLAKDAYKLFETINNRGLRLSSTDLLKNFILGHSAKVGQETLDDAKIIWSKIIISLDGLDTDNFFRQYMCGILTRKITKSKLVEEFKKYYLKNVQHTELLGEFAYYSDWDKTEEDEDDVENEEDVDEENKVVPQQADQRISIEVFLEKIANAAECYRKIFKKDFKSIKINRSLTNLTSILSVPSNIFLMFYLQSNASEAEKLELLKIFEIFMLRRHICNKRTSENDDIFAKLLRLPEKDLLQGVKLQIMDDYPGDIDFEDNFGKHDFSGILIPRAKYVLSEIEYYIGGNTGEFTLNSGFEVHLEHIIPEKIKPNSWKKKYGDWESYLGVNASINHKKYVSKIGNMTLLAGELNIKASNNPFSAKKECYKKSNIELTKRIIKEYKEFKFSTVTKRGLSLTEIAMKIWKI